MSGVRSDKENGSENSPYRDLAPARKQIVIFGVVITLALVADVIVSWLFDIASESVQGTLGIALFVAALVAVHGVGPNRQGTSESKHQYCDKSISNEDPSGKG
jgi:hypothetical protein